ncbi:transposase [Algoriphagus sanaruensis]|uniref:Transposase IS200-like domain-containing protein n=1 Tax=Algoriphagus sanaruensis TaxID=1727163 RepID=A0A142EI96_9BACT|nr:transposase [Algoriphagus sanaruensis]AMQ54851.1 hypothetical protein AO498_00505 [Algoriphagus sanaruensis]
MRSGHSEIWTHLVFSTKGHLEIFDTSCILIIRQAILDYIEQIEDKQGTFSILSNHIHLLVKLPENMSVNQLARTIQELIVNRLRQEGWRGTLEWEEDYHAHSVSWNRLSSEKSLIERQEIKHKDLSLKDELKFLGL